MKTPPRETLAALKYKYVLDADRFILAHGPLEPHRGFLALIQAMPHVLEKFPHTQLLVIGTGPALPEMLAETHKLGIREQTIFPGEVSEADFAGLYQCCAVFVVPAKDGDSIGGKPAVGIEPGPPGALADALIAELSDQETGLK